jgi:hypothetical protein
VDGNHSTIYTSADILAHPSVQLTRGGFILIGLLSGGDYHPAGLPRCGPGIAHGLAKSGLGDELLEAAQSLTRAELAEYLTTWRESLRSELRTNSHGHLGSKKPSLAKAVPDSFPDIDVLLSYTNPITSATDAGARRTHTPPQWKREPNLADIAHVCELHFEWGLKDIIIKRFRTVLWPSIVLRALRRSALEAVAQSTILPVRERESHQDILGTPSKVLARHFSSMALEADDREDDNSLEDLVVKIHASRTHAYTDGILEYRLEIAPAQLVRLASAGVQGLRKPADTTYDVLPSESEDSDEDDDEDGHVGTGRRKKRRGGGPPPEPDSHLRVWMPACIVRLVLPNLVDRYEAAQEAKRAKKSRPKVPRGTAKASTAKGKGKPALPSRKTVEAPPPPTDAEYFDLDVSSSEELDERASPLPSLNHLPPLPTTPLRDAPLPQVHSEKHNDAMVHAADDVFADFGLLPTDGVHQHTFRTQGSSLQGLDAISDDDDNGDVPGLSKARTHHLSSPSPSKMLQILDRNFNAGLDLSSKGKAWPSITPPAPPSSLPRSALRPFPIAFEEEEGSSGSDCDDPSGLLTFSGHERHHMQHAAPATPPASSLPRLQRRPLPAAQATRKEEEEEESSDDPDTVPAELPVQRPLSPRAQRQPRTPGDPQRDVPPHVGDTSDVLDQHSRRPAQPTSSPSSPSKTARSTQDDLLDRLPRQQRRRLSERSSSSIISISTDDSDDSDDNDGVGPPPLLIARSRTAVSKRLATTAVAGSRQINIEREVIDLT